MVDFVFHHDPKKLPVFSVNCHPVLMYDVNPWNQTQSSTIARPVIDMIRGLGCSVSPLAFDFLSIAMAVTAADTFCERDESANSWSRELNLSIPLSNPSAWDNVSKKLENVLGFLTGDQWSLSFQDGGLEPLSPKTSNKAKAKKKELQALNCVSLFSGGLDSAVGAIDLVSGDFGYKPLLVSHSYKGDAAKQSAVESVLPKGRYSRLAVNADPHLIVGKGKSTDITMRGRSFNFIAMALVGLSALQGLGRRVNKLFIPENGYIALNPPLTRRRVGSLSTRTTHPNYLRILQEVLLEVGFDVEISNPYHLKTKGEMLEECLDQKALGKALSSTVSCSNWHRKGIQCGRCVPCLIRRASVYRAGFTSDAEYIAKNLRVVLSQKGDRDDMLALISAYTKLSKGDDAARWVRESGALPHDQKLRRQLVSVVARGLLEVGEFLKSESAI